jgi:LuxR family maltose regulon positive regulatory protein
MRANAKGPVAAKLRPPRSHAWSVPRERLVSRLQESDARLVLVAAPAGFGKTVVVRDWLVAADRPFAWLSLDPLDDDPSRFFPGLGAALRTLGTEAADVAATAAEGMAGGFDERDVSGFVEALAALDPGVTLVLDDVQHVDGPPLPDFLRALAALPPEGPRLVLLSRVDPPFPLGRLRVTGELLELRQDDLRFTPDEAASFFRVAVPGGIAADLVRTVEERTEGWVAGLRLAAIALQGSSDPGTLLGSFSGSHPFVLDYLLEEAVGRQSPGLQAFLMETSVLPRFTVATCASVTENPAAVELLEEVERNHLFLVSLDDEGLWYRYHHLFSELLEFRLRRLHPERADALIERASAWFAEQGDVQEALQQAARLPTSEPLVRLLDEHGFGIVARTELAGFRRWLSAIDDPLRHPAPMFLAALAWYRVLTERAPELAPVLIAIDDALAALPEGYPEARATKARVQAEVVRAFALRLAGRYEEAIRVSEAVLAGLLDGEVTARGILLFNLACVRHRLCETDAAAELFERSLEENLRAGMDSLVLISKSYLGFARMQTEGVAAARRALEATVAFAEERGIQRLPAFGFVLLHLGMVHLVADELDAAASALGAAVELGASGHEPEVEANALVMLARVEDARGRVEAADGLRRRTEVAGHDLNVNLMTTMPLEWARGRMLARPTGTAEVEADACALDEPLRSGDAWTSTYDGWLAFKVLAGVRAGGAPWTAAAADTLARGAETRRRGLSLCVGRLGGILAREEGTPVWEEVDEWLRFASSHGYVRPLLDFGEPLRDLLRAALGRGLSPEARSFARSLVERMGPEPRLPAAVAEGLAEPLTEREREVLVLLADGLSNKSMAQALYVSLDTVKTHLKHAYAKLGVGSRRDAVRRARALGLAADSDASPPSHASSGSHP